MKDAWKQYFDLKKKFTFTRKVRRDLTVEGLAWDRLVSLTLIEKIPGAKEPFDHRFLVRKGNVGTFRELAAALNEACDFVEKNNPKWAENMPPVVVRED